MVRRATSETRTAPSTANNTMPASNSVHPVEPGPEKHSTFKEVAATAGGVAVGSSIGNAIGRALSSLFGAKQVSADGSTPSATKHQNIRLNDIQKGPCSREMEEFLQCTKDQSDDTVCDGYNEAFRKCMADNYLQ